MNLNFASRLKMVMPVALVLLVANPGFGQGQQKKDTPPPVSEIPPKVERVAGVIVKVEKVANARGVDSKAGPSKDGSKKGTELFRLTVNSNVVWRDWARDQAQVRDEGSPKKDATKGANSVATKGQPDDENSLVVIEVAATTKVETRFRSPTDESSKGVTSPEKVTSDEGTSSKATPSKKSVEFRAEDLQTGLFVETEYRKSGTKGDNMASTITVIRPISVIGSTPAAQSPSK